MQPEKRRRPFEMGLLDREQNKWQESVAALKRVAEIRPASPLTHFRLARALYHLGDNEHAHLEALLQKAYQQTLDLDLEARRKKVQTFIVEMH